MTLAGKFKNAIKTGVGKSQTNDGFTTIYTTPATTDDFASYVIECDVACVGDTGVQISVRVKKANGVFAYIVKSAPIPVGSSLQVVDGQKIVLEGGDSLEALCETSDETVDVIVSLVENVNV